MSGIAVLGYASLDHVITLDGAVRSGQTTRIVSRPETAWPRLGGGPAYVAKAIRDRYEGPVTIVSWLGDDDLGRLYCDRLRHMDLPIDGIAMVPAARSPVSLLIYDAQGGCACLYHSGLPPETSLTREQGAVIRSADWICSAISPTRVTEELGRLIEDRQKLVWIVKNDPHALIPSQSVWLAMRADVIFCNEQERAFLENARSFASRARRGQLIIETQGRRGALFEGDGQRCFVPVEPVEESDPTGAGDTFAGGVLAALMQGAINLEHLGQAGILAARTLLLERLTEKS